MPSQGHVFVSSRVATELTFYVYEDALGKAPRPTWSFSNDITVLSAVSVDRHIW